LIRNAEKKHLYGVSIASMREMARRSLVDAGTARAKLNAERAQLAKAEAAVGSARGRYEHGEATKRASMQRYHVQKAAEAYAKHLSAAKDTMRSVRKAEADLPPDVRAQVRPQRQPKSGPMSSPEARAKMAAAKARLPELRAAREQRLKRQLMRAETVRELRDREIRFNGANPYSGKTVESQSRAARSWNRASSTLSRMVGSSAAESARRVAKSMGQSSAGAQYRAKYPRPEK
jgi:hypothetical protein